MTGLLRLSAAMGLLVCLFPNILISPTFSSDKIELSDAMISAATRTLAGSVLHRDFDQGIQTQLKKLLEDHAGTQKGLESCSKYSDLIRGELEKNGVPTELGHITFVESRCQNEMRNHGENGGIWSFSRFSASMYELASVKGVDERLDPIKETVAAGAFLDEEFRVTQNWPLVILGYRYGKSRIGELEKQLKTKDPVKIQNRLGPEFYLDQVIAAIILSKNLKVFGF